MNLLIYTLLHGPPSLAALSVAPRLSVRLVPPIFSKQNNRFYTNS